MKINPTYLLLALVIFSVWGLRRLGVDENTADTISTLLILGLGASPSVLPTVGKVASKIAPMLVLGIMLASGGRAEANTVVVAPHVSVPPPHVSVPVPHVSVVEPVVHVAPVYRPPVYVPIARPFPTSSSGVSSGGGSTPNGCSPVPLGQPAGLAALAIGGAVLVSLYLYRRRRAGVLWLLAAVLAAGCATTSLEDCTIDVSLSGPAGDRLTCRNHDPIKLKNMNPDLRALILRNYQGGAR